MRGLRDNRGVKHPHFVCSQLSFNCWQLPLSVDHPPPKKIPIFSFLFFCQNEKEVLAYFSNFFHTLFRCGHSSARGQSLKYTLRCWPFFFSLLIPLNEIFHVALSYLRMYACSPGTLWGKHPSKQLQQEKV